MLVATALTDIVDGREQFRVYVTEVLCCRIAADIGTCRHHGLLESETQLVRERLVGYSHAYAPVVGNEVMGQVHGVVEDNGCRFVDGVDEVPCHIGDVPYVALQSRVGVDEADESL